MAQNTSDKIKRDLCSADEQTRWEAVGAIDSIGLLSELLSALNDPSSRIRALAANVVSDVVVRQSVKRLILAFESDSDPEVRVACASCFKRIGLTEIEESLGPAVYDDNENIVSAAISALVDIHSLSPVHQLTALLGHQSWKVRLSASQALVKLSYVTPLVIETINQLRSEPVIVDFEQDQDDQMGHASDGRKQSVAELLELATDIYNNSAKVQLRFEM
jgi:HEAT repeat protein